MYTNGGITQVGCRGVTAGKKVPPVHRLEVYEAIKRSRGSAGERPEDSTSSKWAGVPPSTIVDQQAQLPSGVFIRNSRAAKRIAASRAVTRPTPSSVNTQVCAAGAVARSMDQSLPLGGFSHRSTSTRK